MFDEKLANFYCWHIDKTILISYNTIIIILWGYIMARMGLDKNAIIYRAAQLANDVGLENITLKALANDLNIQPPSLYNHIGGLEDLKKELMFYGWHQVEEQIIGAVAGISGYDAIEIICRTFLEYTTTNPGIFNAMLWYNKFENDESQNATTKIFSVAFKILSSLNISQENSEHLIRTFRSFLEGFALLVNHNAFGNPISINDSFELSLKVLIAGLKTLEMTDN